MRLLTRYLIRGNLFLLFSILLIGTGLYVLTELFDRLDAFLDSGLGLTAVLWYYAVKLPMIISQILPAVFLIAAIAQFSLMIKSREMMALQSGGVSPFAFLRFIIVYGLIWAAAQLAFSQFLGVQGERMANRIWREQVRGKGAEATQLHGIWFIDRAYVVHLGLADPAQGQGRDFLAYRLSRDGNDLEQMIRADSFTVKSRQWTLHNATIITPQTYGYEVRPEYTLSLRQDLSVFLAIDPGSRPSQLPLWELRDAIRNLERSGSNVEHLRTVMHARFAYAASIVVMGVLALAIVLWRSNLYQAIGLGLLFTFIFFAVSTVCNSLGEKGFLLPFIAGWLAVVLFFLMGIVAVVALVKPRFKFFLKAER